MSVALPDWTMKTFSGSLPPREPDRYRVVPEGSVPHELYGPPPGRRAAAPVSGSAYDGACATVPVVGSTYQSSITPPPCGTVDTRIPDALQLMTWTPSREVQTVRSSLCAGSTTCSSEPACSCFTYAYERPSGETDWIDAGSQRRRAAE